MKYLALDDMDLYWTDDDVTLFDELWKDGYNLWVLAKFFERDPDELTTLVIDRAQTNHIRERRNSMFGTIFNVPIVSRTKTKYKPHVVLKKSKRSWNKADVQEFDRRWEHGLSVFELATAFDRNPDDLLLLIMDRKRKKFISNRKGGIFGNRNPIIPKKQKPRPFHEEELEYICKFYEVDGSHSLAALLDRHPETISNQVRKLKREGRFDHYKKLDRYWVEVRA